MPFDLPDDPEEELPDWLKQPAGEPDPAGEEDAPNEGGNQELPDWLSGADQAPEGEMPEDAAEESEGHPDFALGEDDEESLLDDEHPDWLEAIRQRAGQGWQPLEPVPYKDGQPEVPDWLKRIRQRQAEELDSLPPDFSAEDLGDPEDQQSFLARLRSFNQQVEGQPDEAAEEDPAEWYGLEQLEGAGEGEAEADEEVEVEVEADEELETGQEPLPPLSEEPPAPDEGSHTFDIDEFTKQAQQGFVFEADQPEEITEDSPAFELEQFLRSVEESPAEPEPEAGDLAEFEVSEAELQEEPPLETPQMEEASIEEAPLEEQVVEEPATEEPPTEEEPGTSFPPQEEESAEPQEAGWLDNFLGGEAESSETPEWLEDVRSEMDNLPHASAFIMEGEQPVEEEEDIEETSEIPASPSWLSQVERETASLPPLEEVFPGAADLTAGEDELASYEPMDYEEDEDGELDLRRALGADDGEDDELNLAPADLPDWLQAMRPSARGEQQAPPPEETDTKAAGEQVPAQHQPVSGPLADLGEALPVSAPIIGAAAQSATPVTGLQMTETQRKHMALMQDMLAEESPPAADKKTAGRFSPRWQRLVTAALIMLAVLVPLFLGRSLSTRPVQTPMVDGMRQQIASLTSGQLVLVAVDYQPAFSGEMQAVAAPVLDQMLLQGVQLVFLSSQPTGPGLAEQLMQNNLGHHAQVSQGGYLNLGYLAGGNAALVAFASDPPGSLPLPLATGGSRWELAPLANIHSAADFGAVLVLSDDADNARSWIEQVGPYMGDRPLLMALSAQAGPMVSPYSQGQVAGMLAGLPDAVSFAEGQGAGPAQGLWGAFSWGLSLTVLLVAAVSVYTLFRLWREKRG